MPNFDWLKNPAPAEEPLSRPYRPSTDDNDEEDIGVSPVAMREEYRYKRGSLMHKILQFIGNIPTAKREEKINDYLRKNSPEMSEKSRKSIVFEILNLLQKEELEFVFGPSSKAEVAIMGEVDGKIVSAQLDRLAIDDNKVVVVDFKPNRPAADKPDDVPTLYKNQMNAYRKLLEKIYPQKAVEVYILWTNTATLMKIV